MTTSNFAKNVPAEIIEQVKALHTRPAGMSRLANSFVPSTTSRLMQTEGNVFSDKYKEVIEMRYMISLLKEEMDKASTLESRRKEIIKEMANLHKKATTLSNKISLAGGKVALVIFKTLTRLTVSPDLGIDRVLDASLKTVIQNNSQGKSISRDNVTQAMTCLNIVDKKGLITKSAMKSLGSKETSYGLTKPVEDKQRRKGITRKNDGKGTNLIQSAIKNTLEKTAYCIDKPMLDIIKEAHDFISKEEVKAFREMNRARGQERDEKTTAHAALKAVMEDIRSNEYVVDGADHTKEEAELYSEYFDDGRGRLYHEACAGANPQSSDIARSLYSLTNTETLVHKDTESYDMFIGELMDITGWKTMDEIREKCVRIVSNPVKALTLMLKHSKNKSIKTVKKPYSVVKMAFNFMEFETTGCANVTIGIGLDAKCSGTQYYAILAGCAEMMRRTGITTDDVRLDDPYVKSLDCLKGLLANSKKYKSLRYLLDNNSFMDRNFAKTPYMAIQYGGSVQALLGSTDFLDAIDGFVPEEDEELFAEACVGAIEMALGALIITFRKEMTDAVRAKLKRDDTAFFNYTHIDGYVVTHKAYATKERSDYFTLEDGNTTIHFGDKVRKSSWCTKDIKPSASEFARTFAVNFIQGIDALVARKVAGETAQKHGLRGYTSIHDCFRTSCVDAPKLKAAIDDAYIDLFCNPNFNIVKHLEDQLGADLLSSYKTLDSELFTNKNSYYFCQ